MFKLNFRRRNIGNRIRAIWMQRFISCSAKAPNKWMHSVRFKWFMVINFYFIRFIRTRMHCANIWECFKKKNVDLIRTNTINILQNCLNCLWMKRVTIIPTKCSPQRNVCCWQKRGQTATGQIATNANTKRSVNNYLQSSRKQEQNSFAVH